MAAWGAAPEKEVAGECGNTAGGKPRGGDAARGRAGAIEGDGAHLRPLQRPPVASALRPLQGRGTQRQEGHGRRCGGGRACQNSCVSFTVLWGRISISVFIINSFPAGSMFHVKKNSSCSRFKNWLFKNPIVRRAPSHGTVHFGPKQRPRNQISRKFEELAARVHKQSLVHEGKDVRDG